MFTIKVRAADGTETIYSAETIEVVGGPNCSPMVTHAVGDTGQRAAPAATVYEEGIFLDREAIPLDPSDPNSPRSAKYVIQFGGDETATRAARKGGKVWIMNEAGATVATYDL